MFYISIEFVVGSSNVITRLYIININKGKATKKNYRVASEFSCLLSLSYSVGRKRLNTSRSIIVSCHHVVLDRRRYVKSSCRVELSASYSCLSTPITVEVVGTLSCPSYVDGFIFELIYPNSSGGRNVSLVLSTGSTYSVSLNVVPDGRDV